jgi:hypothetical protein
MKSESRPRCPVCLGEIKIKHLEEAPLWAAKCDCSYVEAAIMTGITLRLKRAAINKNQNRKETTKKTRDAGRAATIQTG